MKNVESVFSVRIYLCNNKLEENGKWKHIPVAVGTKNNVIFKSFANESAGSIIKCIAISFWTSLLEKG